MEEKIITLGHAQGTQNGWKVYSTGGVIATLGASDFKHNKMIVVWLKSK